MRPFIAKAAMAAALIYAGVVWVGAPLWAADHLLPTAILGVGLGMALIFQAIMQLRAAEGSAEAPPKPCLTTRMHDTQEASVNN
jgi:hypothetical protein